MTPRRVSLSLVTAVNGQISRGECKKNLLLSSIIGTGARMFSIVLTRVFRMSLCVTTKIRLGFHFLESDMSIMRQPVSVYTRSAHRSILRFCDKVNRRARKVFSRADGKNSKPQRESRALVDAATLSAAMDALGLAAGDTVMVHSGISNLGKVVGGPRVIFELIRDRVGPTGHVLYPVFPFGSLMAVYLESNPTFDVRTAPSKMGALTEFALKTSGGLRSVHPTHSVLAFGPRSAEFVNEHHLCQTPFTDRSPFGQLVNVNGKILIIGVGLNSTTSFHRTEDRLGSEFPVRVYLPKLFRIPCFDAKGVPLEVHTQAHDPFISRIRDCDLMRSDFLRTGVLHEAPVGDGVIGIISARGMDQFLEDLWRTRQQTIYGRIWG